MLNLYRVADKVVLVQILQSVRAKYDQGNLSVERREYIHRYLFKCGFQDEFVMNYASLAPELYTDMHLDPSLPFEEILDFTIESLIDDLIFENEGANYA